MYMVKRRKNRGNTFGEGWGTISPTFLSTKRRILEGSGGRMAGGGLSKPLGSGRRGKKGRVGEEGACGGPGHSACRARRGGATRLSRHCMWRNRRAHVTCLRGSPQPPCQRGTPVAPPVLARQRLIVAPSVLARPNGLCRANKTAAGLN